MADDPVKLSAWRAAQIAFGDTVGLKPEQVAEMCRDLFDVDTVAQKAAEAIERLPSKTQMRIREPGNGGQFSAEKLYSNKTVAVALTFAFLDAAAKKGVRAHAEALSKLKPARRALLADTDIQKAVTARFPKLSTDVIKSALGQKF